jgi:hypothetical protein
MAAVREDDAVIWPDMGGFGAELKLVVNPSLDRKYLKFVVLDRERFARTGGGEGSDLCVRLREAGFAYSANETAGNAGRAWDAAVGSGHDIARASQAVRAARQSLFFYSRVTQLTHARMQQLVPALSDEDYCSMPISRIRETDRQFLAAPLLADFIHTQQQLRGATPGTWFTGPAERELMARAAQLPLSVHEVLEYRDLPPPGAPAAEDNLLANLRAFAPVRLMEMAVRRQTLDLLGLPLRAPGLDVVLIGYATRAAAIRANGGRERGIEQHVLQYSVPVGFDAERERLMVVRDARYLEYNLESIPAANEMHGVQRHLDFMTAVEAIREHYQVLSEAGLDKADAWCDIATTERVKARADAIFGLMKGALAPFDPTQGFMTVSDISRYGCQRERYFRREDLAGFIDFLPTFRTQLYNAVTQHLANLKALAGYDAGMARIGLAGIGETGPIGTLMDRPDRAPGLALPSMLHAREIPAAGDAPLGQREDHAPRRASAAHLPEIVRRGEPWRAGIDITEEMLRETFGVRAVSFGIWLPESERQQVMNHAFDALMDQSAVLGLPATVIGLSGTLSLAFGCRGRAGVGALEAHFEPRSMILHLPGLVGAGTVSRAWARAFDAWLARTALGGEHDSVIGMSSDVQIAPGSLPPVVDAFLAIARRMK